MTVPFDFLLLGVPFPFFGGHPRICGYKTALYIFIYRTVTHIRFLLGVEVLNCLTSTNLYIVKSHYLACYIECSV